MPSEYVYVVVETGEVFETRHDAVGYTAIATRVFRADSDWLEVTPVRREVWEIIEDVLWEVGLSKGPRKREVPSDE